MERVLSRKRLLQLGAAAGVATLATLLTPTLSRPTDAQIPSYAFEFDWVMLNHGRYGQGVNMQGLRERIIQNLPGLVDPDHIITPDYPNPANPNLEAWMSKRMEEIDKAAGFGNRGWMWDYSASAPVGLSALGRFGEQLPATLREHLRLRIIGGGIRGQTNLYDLVNTPNFEEQVKPHLGGGIDHLHGSADQVITAEAAADLARKFGYQTNLRLLDGVGHNTVLSSDELMTKSLLAA